MTKKIYKQPQVQTRSGVKVDVLCASAGPGQTYSLSEYVQDNSFVGNW